MRQYGDKDEYLEERLARVDKWMGEGKIPASSKVVPLAASLSGLQWILPTQQVLEILRNMRGFALAKCLCRLRYQRCDNPLEVCLLTNDTADQWVARGEARRVTLEEAGEQLRLAQAAGLVHLSFYSPQQYLYALCSCCECCCHDLQFLKKYRRPDLIARADYVAAVDAGACSGCGICAGRCVFGAQEKSGRSVIYHQDRCYGCGVCATTCPNGAITMKLRATSPGVTAASEAVGPSVYPTLFDDTK